MGFGIGVGFAISHLATVWALAFGIWHRCGFSHFASVSVLAFGIWHRCGFRQLAFGIGGGLVLWYLASMWV